MVSIGTRNVKIHQEIRKL